MITNKETSELHALSGMTILDAKAAATKIIEASKTKAIKKQHLLRDISNAPSTKEVERIMWMSALAADGLHSFGSTWNKDHS
jgi:hypothetical protein